MVTVSKAAVLKIIFDSVGKPATEIYQKVRELPPAETERPRWIPVTERLPGHGESVLMYYERNAWDENGNRFRKRTIDVGFQYNGIWHVDGCSGVDGLAWMPLPEPPKEEA